LTDKKVRGYLSKGRFFYRTSSADKRFCGLLSKDRLFSHD